MTIGTLVLYIAIIAIAITLLIGFIKKSHKNWVMTFLQNFTGVLFLISGWVKAVDPMGTAFKLEQYFAEFESTFESTWANFIAPVFPFLAEYAIGFSVFMIVFEMVLGVMLLLGIKSKLTAWLFLILVAFFTILTGFTFLTGYVPSGENFFTFSAWGGYDPNNMRVTDCGCFGDFIKLEPRTSFFKDIVLMVPALLFVFRHKDMHQLVSQKLGNGIILIFTIGLTLYCLKNFLWDLPHTDFRPFSVNADIAKQKLLEEEAMANVQIVSWTLKNITNNEVRILENVEYLKNLKAYPKQEWEVVGQGKSEPEIPITKISDFEIVDSEGYSVTEDILSNQDPVFMIVCYKLKGNTDYVEVPVSDTIYEPDPFAANEDDSTIVKMRIKEIIERSEIQEQYTWKPGFVKKFKETLNPFLQEGKKSGVESFVVAGGASAPMMEDFRDAVDGSYPFFEADDILLKTIIRSNPGVVLIRNGKILDKWHISQLPDFNEVRVKYLKD